MLQARPLAPLLFTLLSAQDAAAMVRPDRQPPELIQRVRLEPPRVISGQVELAFEDGELLAMARADWTGTWDTLRFDAASGAFIDATTGTHPLHNGVRTASWCGTHQAEIRSRSGETVVLPRPALYAAEREDGRIAMILQPCQGTGGSWTSRHETVHWDGIEVEEAQLVVWDPASRTVISALTFTDEAVGLVAGDAAGRAILVAGGGGGLVRLDVDAQRSEAIQLDGWAQALVVSSDASVALVAHDDGLTALVDDERHELQLDGARMLAISPDGRLALASGGLELLVWDLETGMEQRTPLPQPLTALAVSPDGARMAAVTQDGQVAVSSTSEPRLPEPASTFDCALALNPDGSVGIWTPDRALRLSPTGGLEPGPDDQPAPAAPGPEDFELTRLDDTVRIEDLRAPDSAPLELPARGFEGTVRAVGEHAVFTHRQHGIVAWTPSTGELRFTGLHPSGPQPGLAAGRWWAQPSDGTIELADVATGLRWGAFQAHQGIVEAMAADDDRLATIGTDGTVAVWRLPEPGPVPAKTAGLPTGATGRVTRLGASCSRRGPVPWVDGAPACDEPVLGRTLARPSPASWDRAEARVFACRMGQAVALDEDRHLCFVHPYRLEEIEPRRRGDEDIVLVRGARVLRRYSSHPDGVTELLAAQDGALFLAWNRDAERIQAWNPRRRKPRWEYALDDSIVHWAFSPDGTRVALRTSEGPVLVLDREGALVGRLDHGHRFASLLWAPDSARLLVSGEGNILSWRPEDEAEPIWPPGDWRDDRGSFEASSFSPDGRLAIVNRVGQVLVLDREGQLEPEGPGHTQRLLHFGFTPEGTLLTASARAWHEWSLQGEHLQGETPGGILAVSADGRWLARRDGEQIVVSERGGDQVLWTAEVPAEIGQVLISDDGHGLAIRTHRGEHRVLHADGGGLRFEEGLRIEGIAPDGSAAVVTSDDKVHWVTSEGQATATQLDALDEVAVTDSGIWLRAGWDLHRWQPGESLAEPSASCRNARKLTAHGSWLSCTNRSGIDLLDAQGGYRLGLLPTAGLRGRTAVSRDGRLLATMDDNGDITLWDLEALLASVEPEA